MLIYMLLRMRAINLFILLCLFPVFSMATDFNTHQELFEVADTDPSYVSRSIRLNLDPLTGDALAIEIATGPYLNGSKKLNRFAPGDRFRKYYIMLENQSFTPDRGGVLRVTIGKQSVEVNVVRDRNYWSAEVNQKRISKLIAKVRRWGDYPIWIDHSVPLEIEWDRW